MKLKFFLIMIGFALSLNLAAQNFTTMIYETWVNETWKNSVRQTNTVDSKGNIIQVASDTWNSTSGSWDKNALTTYTLNTNSSVASTLTKVWNKTGNKWEDSQQAVYTWDALGKNLLTLRTKVIFISAWIDYSLTTNTYDASNQLTLSVGQSLDMVTMQLKNSFQITNTYNADGTENQSIHKIWNPSPGSWDNTSRTTYTYNSSKKPIIVLMEDYQSGSWKNDLKTTLTYNTDQTLKDALQQVWDTGTNNWTDESKEFHTYLNGNNTQILIQEWSGTIWKNDSRITFTYGLTSVGQPGLPAEDHLLVYPNPSAGEISISGNSTSDSDISIFNMEGQLVKTIARGSSLMEINLHSLNNGVYVVRAGKPGAEQVTRFIINK